MDVVDSNSDFSRGVDVEKACDAETKRLRAVALVDGDGNALAGGEESMEGDRPGIDGAVVRNGGTNIGREGELELVDDLLEKTEVVLSAAEEEGVRMDVER